MHAWGHWSITDSSDIASYTVHCKSFEMENFRGFRGSIDYRYLTKTLLYLGKRGTVPSKASIKRCKAIFLHSFIVRGALNRNADDETNKEPHYFAGQTSR